ncbi:MAG: hypothetical protein HY369_03230 [Candidatus Aenigmarchaeota archaeon]|nr:hypothetical protein [Candidatus Aenigmarchaeota archaeon]
MSIKEEEAVERAVRFIESRHGNLEMLDFQVQAVTPAGGDVWVVRCTLFPKIGWETKVGYNARVNIKTGDVDLEQLAV